MRDPRRSVRPCKQTKKPSSLQPAKATGKAVRVATGTTLLVRSFSEEEEDLLIKLHALLGNRWSLIAGRLPGRTEEEVKNHWNSHMRAKLKRMGVDPDNHRAKTLPLPDHEQRRRARNECEEQHSDRDRCSCSKDDIAVGDCAVSDAGSSSS